MKKMMRDGYLWVATIDSNKMSLVAFVIALAMFVVAAGAPEAGGTSVR